MTRWGIIGAGGIARVFANGVRFSKTGTLVALASLTESRRDAFASDFEIPRRYARYEDLLADKEVDAVYIAVIHPLHAKCAVAAAEAGKHILVEKPMGMNAREAARMIEAARRHDVFLMEAFMYRCHPQMARLADPRRRDRGRAGHPLDVQLLAPVRREAPPLQQGRGRRGHPGRRRLPCLLCAFRRRCGERKAL
jgi:predicted dehydrogenase